MSRMRRFRLSRSATAMVVGIGAICAAWAIGANDPGPAGRAVCAAVAFVAGALWDAQGDAWVAPSLRSPLTVYAGCLALGMLVLLYVVVGVLWRLGQVRRGKPSGQQGTAVLEFALLFPIALTIILILLQSMLVVSGNLNVHYAAYAAARSAIVWAAEKVSYDEGWNIIGPIKMDHVKRAAVYAVMPISAGKSGAGGAGGGTQADLIRAGMGTFYQNYNRPAPGWVQNMLSAKYQYATGYTEVVLDPPVNGQVYGDREDLRAHVRHTLYLSIPWANRLFGKQLSAGDFGVDVFASYALTNQGVEDEIDIEQFPRQVGKGGS